MKQSQSLVREMEVKIPAPVSEVAADSAAAPPPSVLLRGIFRSESRCFKLVEMFLPHPSKFPTSLLSPAFKLHEQLLLSFSHLRPHQHDQLLLDQSVSVNQQSIGRKKSYVT